MNILESFSEVQGGMGMSEVSTEGIQGRKTILYENEMVGTHHSAFAKAKEFN